MNQHADVPSQVLRHQALAHEDPQLRALMPDPAVEAALADPDSSYVDVLERVFEGYASRPALGRRVYDVVADAATGRAVRELRPEFETITYAELRRRVTAAATTLRQPDDHRVEAGDFVCVVGFNGIDYVTMELACVFLGAVDVPLIASMGRPTLERIFADTAPTLVASTVSDLELIAELVAAQASVRTLVALDLDVRVDDDRARYEAAAAILAQRGSRTRLTTLGELIGAGAALPWEPPPPCPDGAERVALLIHSSGTTGTPKGAIVPERIARGNFLPAPVPLPLVRLSLAPLNHSAGRAAVYGTIAHGGTTFFIARSDLSTLFEDIALVRPTDGFFFPRALEIVRQRFQNDVARRLRDGAADEDSVRRGVLADLRDNVLGGRLCVIHAAGAPTTPEVRRFVVEELGIPLTDGYGSTEVGPVTTNGVVNRANVVDYRLRDVPELGYFTTDRPYPRGELCVKTRSVIPGYFKQPEATAALFDADGFAIVGDIVEERGPDHLVYIDRRNDVLKLAQGEFVAVGALGNIFEDGSDLIHQIFVYGNAARSYLLAVVVPDRTLARQILGRDPLDAELRDLVRSEITRVAASAGLRAFEVPRDVIIATEPFSVDNGMLTALRKRVRPEILRCYGARLEQLYAAIEAKEQVELAELREGVSGLTTLEKIAKALEATLGVEGVDVHASSSFVELGGDSLGAITFAALLEDIVGVEVSVSAILSPSASPAHWARLVEAAPVEGTRSSATFATVHGAGARRLDAEDLQLRAFIDAAVLDHAPTDRPSPTEQTVLLTGATGFLGRFLCLEWMERLADVPGGRLICLVRAPDHAAAVHRLDAVFGGLDSGMEKRYRELGGVLEVVVGDVAEPWLGLEREQYQRLAGRVDRLVHPAALVNHVLDYEFLFGPNVAGVAALIGFALTERTKAIDFVSSAAVTRFLDRSNRDDEDAPLLDTVDLSEEYASGYGASKWAAEHLLQAASRDFGLPVNVFRGDMMLPHRDFHGQINVDDVFTRLIYSIITTGLAPRSFYEMEADGSRPRAHYDALPVDFVAAAIVGIAGRDAAEHDGLRRFNVTNHADDGVSLDVFVDWIEAAGHPIERVDDYAEWVQRFEPALRSLPESGRQLSSLQVLDSMRRPAAARGVVGGSRRFDDALRSLDIGPETPRITHEYFTKCLDDMVRLGLVPSADRA